MKELTRKELLKKRKDIRCTCKRKRPINDRIKYGTCRCDAFSFYYTMGTALSNSLWQYLADAKQIIVREDWDIIEKHAKAIGEYANSDDFYDTTEEQEKIYQSKEKAWKEAMEWLTENWKGLWW